MLSLRYRNEGWGKKLLGLNKNKYDNLKKLTVVLAVVGILGGVKAYRNVLSPKDKQPTEIKNSREVAPSVKKPIARATYYNDTIVQNQSILLLNLNGKIIRYYKEGNESFRMQLPLFVHEWWHGHNADLKYRTNYNLSPEEYFKLCLHDEISANLAAVLTARFEYLASDNKEAVIKKYENTYMNFYFKAIKTGKIKPEATDAVSRDGEWRFLADGVQNMWMNTYYQIYIQRTLGMLENFLNRKELVSYNGNNYEKIRHKMYKIGGVDFANYMTSDIIIKNNKVKITDSVYKVEDLRKGGKETLNTVSRLYPLLKEVGLDNRRDVFQHVLISARMRDLLKNISADNLMTNGPLIDTYFKQVCHSFKTDDEYKKILHEVQQYIPIFPIIKDDENKTKSILQQIYTINGVDISQFIKDFDLQNVPLNKSGIASLEEKQSYWFNYMPVALALEKLKNKKNSNNKEAQNNLVETDVKKKISEDFYVAVPNFCEPILTKATNEDMEAILGVVRKFNAIPAVLKGCNTEEKRKYAAQHPDTIAKLKLGREYLAQQ